jgi:hypothetical protein
VESLYQIDFFAIFLFAENFWKVSAVARIRKSQEILFVEAFSTTFQQFDQEQFLVKSLFESFHYVMKHKL